MDRKAFLAEFGKRFPKCSHADRAIALLWFYWRTEQFEERSANDLAKDLHDEGYAKPDVSRLKEKLKKTRFVALNATRSAHRINAARANELDSQYSDILQIQSIDQKDSIIPIALVAGKDQFLEKLVVQINGSYNVGHFDACAVVMRRLIETLIIKIFLVLGRRADIQDPSGAFLGLEALINKISNDSTVTLARDTGKDMKRFKEVGDAAAHHRSYITSKHDIDDLKHRYRRVADELLGLAYPRQS